MPLWMLVRQGMFFLNLIVFLGMLLYECSGQKKRTELFMDLVVFLDEPVSVLDYLENYKK